MTAPAAANGSGHSRQDRPEYDIDTMTFRFRCLGYAFRAWIQQDGEGDGGGRSICVACDVGDLPYSVENREGRRNALMVLSRAAHIAGTRLILSGFHHVSIMSSLPLGDDHDSMALLSRAVAAALNATPLLSLVSDCLSGPDAPAQPDQLSLGSTNT